MSIYRTGNSPFWHVRIYDNLRKRYIVRSSKEKARLTAKEVAEELFDEHRSKKNQAVAVSRDTSFRHYAEKLQAHEKAMAARMRGKRFFTDTRAILAPTVRKGSKEKRIGMLEYFGEYDVSKITAGMVREYFQKVDEKRDTPLAASTKAKHGMVIRKVLTLAYEDGLIDSLPPMPKNRVKDNPRTSFTEAEYKHLLKVTRECIERGDLVRNTAVPWDMYYLIVMLVHTFMRPTESEIFAIRHCDVTVKDDPRCLHIMANGKTGMREVTTMPDAVDFYETLKELNPEWQATDRLLFPVYGSVVTAASMARRFFTHILAVAKLQKDSFGRPRSLYSLRHYALQLRLRKSKGKVNIYWLAKNAGTSVDQLERFYLKGMALSEEQIQNLHSFGE